MKRDKNTEIDKDLLELEQPPIPPQKINVCVFYIVASDCGAFVQICELPHKQSLICGWYEELAQCAIGEFAFAGLFIRLVFFYESVLIKGGVGGFE